MNTEGTFGPPEVYQPLSSADTLYLALISVFTNEKPRNEHYKKYICLCFFFGVYFMSHFFSLNDSISSEYGLTKSTEIPVFPKYVVKLGSEQELQNVTRNPHVAICAIDDCDTADFATTPECSVHTSISSAMGVHNFQRYVNFEVQGKYCFDWGNGDKRSCVFLKPPDNFINENEEEVPFYYYRYQGIVRCSATVVGHKIKGIMFGLFDSKARNEYVKSVFTMDWTFAPLGKLTDIAIKSHAYEIDETINTSDRDDKVSRHFSFSPTSLEADVDENMSLIVLRSGGDESISWVQIEPWQTIDYFEYIGAMVGFIDLCLGLISFLFFCWLIQTNSGPVVQPTRT